MSGHPDRGGRQGRAWRPRPKRRPTFAVALAVAALAAAVRPAVARADDDCRPSLDASVTVAAGTERACGIWVVGHDAVVERGAEVDGGVFAAYGRAVVDGEVRGSVNVVGGDAAVGGRVAGDVYATGDVRLGAGARVTGRVTGGQVAVDRRARVDGQVVELGRGWAGLPAGGGWTLLGTGRAVLNVLVTVALGALFGALAVFSLPRRVERLRDAAARPLGWTVLATMIGLGCLAAALAVALLPFGPAVLVWLVPISLAAVGSLGIGARLGRRLTPRRSLAAQTALGLAAVIAVIAVLNQSGHLVLLCGGTMLLLIGSAWSIGVALVAWPRRGARSDGPATAVAPAIEPSPTTPSVMSASAAPAIADASAAPAIADAPAAPAIADAPATPAATDPPAAAAPVAGDAPDAPPTRAATPSPAASQPPGGIDPLDLRRIPGITPVYAHLLRAGGIGSLAALAEREPDEIVACLAVPDVIGIDRATAELWVAMARRRIGH